MRLCVIWNLHQANSWHPTQRAFGLPWTRIQTLRSYLPFLRMAADFPGAPLTLAISPDVLRHLEQTTLRATRETMLDIHRKPAADLRPAEVTDLVSFGLGAASAKLVSAYPAWQALWDRWQAHRGIVSRFVESVDSAELQDLQAVAQLGWLDDSLKARVPDLEEKARQGLPFHPEDATRLADLQIDAMHEFLQLVRELGRIGRIEILGAPLHRTVLPLLCDAGEGYSYPEDARAQIIRGPRVHYLQFGIWPPVLYLPEGGLCEHTSRLIGQACLERAVSSSRVLARSLGTMLKPEETGACWEHHGRTFLFTDAEICDQIRFVYPHLSSADAARDLWKRVSTFARECTEPDATLTLDIDLALGADAGADHPKALWRAILGWLAGTLPEHAPPPIQGSTVSAAMAAAPRQTLPRIRGFSRRVRGFAAWNAASRPLYWKLLRHAREQFQNIRAWKTLSPERMQDAKASLFVLESADWVSCMEPGLDPFTQRKREDLFRAHLDCIYRSLEIPRPPWYSEPLMPCEVKVTSIAPSQDITPAVNGKASSYSTWSGSGFYRTREEGGCSRDFLRQLTGVYFGSDSVNVYLRVALPAPAREMLRDFELQGVMHASEGEQTVSWFRIGQSGDGETRLDTRLALPSAARGNEQSRAAVDDVADLQIPLSGLGVRLGEILRFQVSLWERGNAVASAPALGWEEFLIGDHLTYEGDSSRSRSPVDWGVTAK